jgi:hypothetical protein
VFSRSFMVRLDPVRSGTHPDIWYKKYPSHSALIRALL